MHKYFCLLFGNTQQKRETHSPMHFVPHSQSVFIEHFAYKLSANWCMSCCCFGFADESALLESGEHINSFLFRF